MRRSSRVALLTKRNIKEIIRDPLSLIFLIAMPLAMELMFYFLFHGKTSQFEMKYLAPGIVVFSQAFLTLFSGLLIAVDRGTAFLTRLYVSKCRPHHFIFGYAIALIPLAGVQSILFFLVGGIIDTSLFCVGMLYGFLMSFVTSLMFIGLGILFGSLCNERSIGGVASVIISGQSLLSGMWFPTEGLSGGFLAVMNCLPFKNAADLLKNVLTGTEVSFDTFWRPLLIVLGYTVVIFVIAISVFRAKMKAK